MVQGYLRHAPAAPAFVNTFAALADDAEWEGESDDDCVGQAWADLDGDESNGEEPADELVRPDEEPTEAQTEREEGVERHAMGVDAEEEGGDAMLPVGFPTRHERGEAPAVRERAAWARRQARRPLGETVAHVRFLQDYFRRSVRVRAGCWSKGGMVGLWWARPQTKFKCGGGKNLAEGHEFEEYRREVVRPCLDWYRGYVELHRAWHAGRTPTALVPFCGQGGTSEGVRRAGGASHGQDKREQPRYEARFGRETFSQGDSCSPHELREMTRATGAFVTMASPPCKAYSTGRVRGEAQEEPMIGVARDSLRELGGLWALENVTGARRVMDGTTTLLRGSYFGEQVDRPRLWENNFRLHVDRVLVEGGARLRDRSCLGFRRRYRRKDPWGRPEMKECCAGNLWAVQGDKPLRCTMEECAWAMGVDRDHMDYDGLAQAVPPVYGQYVFGIACMRALEAEFGLPVITYDEMLRDPERSRRLMHHWLRGSGGPGPGQGVELRAAVEAGAERAVGEEAAGEGERLAPETPTYEPVHGDAPRGQTAERAVSEEEVHGAELRELEYSWAGGFTQTVGPDGAFASLDAVRAMRVARVERGWAQRLVGENSLVMVSGTSVRREAGTIAALCRDRRGTRVTMEACGVGAEQALARAGFQLVARVGRGEARLRGAEEWARSRRPRSYWATGRIDSGGETIDYDLVDSGLDERDRKGAPQEPKTAKTAYAYCDLPWEPKRWDVGLPRELDEIMARSGVGIYPIEELGPSEVPFYKWANDEGLMKSIVEADRALASGAMEYVPASRVAEVLAASTIHPWTVVDQGGGKWRLCHDYSVGTNRTIPAAPFTLPSVWDVCPTVKAGSHFAKYDIRDGFWHVPIRQDSRKRLVVRHPGNGRLLWASRLPFGYLEAPRLFCGLTEAVIQRLRVQAAGKGIHFFVFVDDVLVVGDTEELTREGCRLLEEEFRARGLQWAPGKTRGPSRCMEFLGLLLCNLPGLRGVSITRKRAEKLRKELEGWQERRAEVGRTEVDPTELASLLGKLVFSSQVVRGGRTYMQGMLAAFQGFVVDWRRGVVTPRGGGAQRLTVRNSFWRDVEWWLDHLDRRSLTPFEHAVWGRAELVMAGTDASDWGTGQVVWLDGGREETVLEFGPAERRRPINWRELLGIVRVAEVAGSRLRGKTVLIETDNMAAKGAGSKMSSKAEDMQELVRRLLHLSERHGFTVRLTHTPGVKLDRPDQTSRGAAAEEPRARLARDLWTRVEERWGPFGHFLGAEREMARAGPPVGRQFQETMWVHPTMATVGTALRRVGERLVATAGHGSTALALVPDDSLPQWNQMLRHGLVVGRIGEGESGLCMNMLGRWAPRPAHRAAQLVLFPRAAGARARRVWLTAGEAEVEVVLSAGTEHERVTTAGEGYEVLPGGRRLRVLPGSFVYSLPLDGDVGARGCLYQVGSASELEGAGGAVAAREAVLDGAKSSRALSKLPVFEVAKGAEVWRPAERQLWTVDHWVEQLRSGARTSKFAFDFHAANAAIRAAGGSSADDPGDGSWVVSPQASTSGRTASGASEFDHVWDEACWPGFGGSEPGSGDGAYEQYEPSPWSRVGQEEMSATVAELERLRLAQHQGRAGPEGRIVRREAEAEGGEREGVAGRVVQPCQYSGLSCAGCGGVFDLGEMMLSHGNALVHDCELCERLHDRSLEEEREAEGRDEEVWYGVYSDEVGASGTYRRWEEVERLVSPAESVAREHASYGAFATEQEAQAFVLNATNERSRRAAMISAGDPAGALAPGGRAKGSVTKRTIMEEKLSAERLERIDRCIAGHCRWGRGRDLATQCRGGCGKTLHVGLCAQLGKGYVALGNFTCVECRIISEGVDPATLEEDSLHRQVARRTMVLELGQGKETTTAGYADYVKLEERYAAGVGRLMAGGLALPRHSVTTFMNFVTWFVLYAARAKSLESMLRSAGAFLTKVPGLQDWTKDPRVKAHVKDLVSEMGVEHEEATTATPRMLQLLVRDGGVIDRRYPTSTLLAGRAKIQAVCEGVGGCRIGEVVGGADGHGLLANSLSIVEPLDGEAAVMLHLEHSKTGFSRDLVMAGKTATTGVDVAQHMRRWWKLSGWKTKVSLQAGMKVTRPDFWVVRVSLLGMSRRQADGVAKAVRSCQLPAVVVHARSTATYVLQRYDQQELTKKYVNIAGGGGNDRTVRDALTWARNQGWNASLVPGPALCATTGGKKPKPTLMPLATSSTFAVTKELLATAHREATGSVGDPDRDLDLADGADAKWSTHSLRRLADTVARKYMEISGTSEEEIDLYFGWNERVLLKAMQVHYASMSLEQRVKLSKVTGML